MPAKIPKFSYPVPSNRSGHAFASAEELLSVLDGESSGQYLVGSQGMWHGGIHITDATVPWCALSAGTDAEQTYRSDPYKGEQFIRCMADGEIVAYRVCPDYPSISIPWRDEKLFFSNSFVLVKHKIQPGEDDTSGLTFYTLYMNLAPFSAYAQQSGEDTRKIKGVQKYYLSADDVQAKQSAGKLVAGTQVTLGDKVITRDSDHRQFSELTVTAATTNSAGTILAAGTPLWTVSDWGNLIAGTSVTPPSWWVKCTPSYSAQVSDTVNAKARTNWSYYLSSDDVLQNKSEGKLVADFPVSYQPGNAAQQVVRPTDNRTFSLVTLGRDVGQQKKGDRVWVVSDGDSLTPTAASPSGSQPVFGGVVVPSTPVAISAGDSLGHMGFFQLPEENGKRSRYQVHIECLSMDSKLPVFLTNPGQVGTEEKAAFLKYPEGASLFIKNAQGQMADSTRKTLAQDIVMRSAVPTMDTAGEPAYYQIIKENGWLAASDIQKVSQYALGERGFVTLDKAPESFDLIDGIKHPDNVVKGILEQMYKGARDETRTSHALNEYNYKRLLDQIDSNHDGDYSEEEYLQAVHNVSYRDHLYRIIARHGSEWYYGKDDPLWKTYLDTLTTDAPQWKTYTEDFIGKITWMKSVEGMGPEPWHMHPVVFSDAISQVKNKEIIFPLKVKPKNDIEGVWKRYYWAASLTDSNASQAIFGRNRAGGIRKHAARDLYTKPYEKVVSICDGKVLGSFPFYEGTNEVTILHTTDDGRKFIARYGELDPPSITVRRGDEVKQGHHIGNTGKLVVTSTGQPVLQIGGTVVYMLHFELYTGRVDYNINIPLTDRVQRPFLRRADLIDPIDVLSEGYANTFLVETSRGERLDINTLRTSESGKDFIKGWESLRLNAYNDSEGYCTIGYGHLIEEKRCEIITLPSEYSNGITQKKADEMFSIDLERFESGVKQDVQVDLYQHEFDALVSLLFNCGEFFFATNGAPSLLRKINAGEYESAANEFLDITNGGNSGLVKRRSAENNIYLNGIYDSSH
jgi:GH24 family phage-related lysozyme (muramidase)